MNFVNHARNCQLEIVINAQRKLTDLYRSKKSPALPLTWFVMWVSAIWISGVLIAYYITR